MVTWAPGCLYTTYTPWLVLHPGAAGGMFTLGALGAHPHGGAAAALPHSHAAGLPGYGVLGHVGVLSGCQVGMRWAGSHIVG